MYSERLETDIKARGYLNRAALLYGEYKYVEITIG